MISCKEEKQERLLHIHRDNRLPGGYLMNIEYTKMQGAGNDFIVINNIEKQFTKKQLARIAQTLCRRRYSVGADGLMVVVPPEKGGDFGMLFFNSDGSQAEMCGNGARCIAKYGYERRLAGTTVKIETTAGMVTAWQKSENLYKIQLNAPSGEHLLWFKAMGLGVSYVLLGNPGIPHAVAMVPGISEKIKNAGGETVRDARLYAMGRTLRFDPHFPKGANVNFYETEADGTVSLATYERGVEDFTPACGTGTGAVAYVLAGLDMCAKGAAKDTEKGNGVKINVRSAGGLLSVDITKAKGETQIYLTGPAVTVSEGIAYS